MSTLLLLLTSVLRKLPTKGSCIFLSIPASLLSLLSLLSLFGTRRHQVQTNRSKRALSLRLSQWLSPSLELCLLLRLEPHRGLPCGICNCCCFCCFCYTWLLLLLLSTHLNTNAFVQKTPTMLRQVDEGTTVLLAPSLCLPLPLSHSLCGKLLCMTTGCNVNVFFLSAFKLIGGFNFNGSCRCQVSRPETPFVAAVNLRLTKLNCAFYTLTFLSASFSVFS